MAILHSLRTFRHILKGTIGGSRIVKDPDNIPKVLTNRIYVGLRLVDLFAHVNNARYIELFELSRWEVFTATGFSTKMFQTKIFPVVANAHVNYYRQLLPFQIATVQTVGLGITSKGNQFLVAQHIYDHKKRLCATGIFHISLLDFNTNKSLKIKDGFAKMGVNFDQVVVLEGTCLDTDDISLESIERYKKLAEEKGGMHLADFFPKINEHIATHPKAIQANVEAGAYLSDAGKYFREWFRSPAEGKGTTKKKNDQGVV